MTLFLIAALYIVLTAIWTVCAFGIFLMAYGLITTNVPYVPIPGYVVEEIKKTIPLKKGDVLYDLGSGDGRIVHKMAASYPEAQTIGVEKAPLPYLLSRLRSLFHPLPNTKTLFKSFAHVPLDDATHIYIYLFPEVVQKLLVRFEKELKPGTKVVSCDFPFKTKEPASKILVG